ncbi:hypothetical protein T07_12286 [Trichinella nelsoni]|uniref:Uncharacterized protein n=1 Tax=Trichinella nelsoni TaxID=6336 RepID=A0A0V0RGD7_9BILA|nr:hypothetical protein T07_12286 [Trichinella nelsoni]
MDFTSNTKTAKLTFSTSMKADASNSKKQRVECQSILDKSHAIVKPACRRISTKLMRSVAFTSIEKNKQ